MRDSPRPNGTIPPIGFPTRRKNPKRGPTSLLGVYERDHGVCWLCYEAVPWEATRKPLLPTRDHVVKVADLGPNTPENLRLAHLGCNTRRHTADVEGFPGWIRSMLAEEPPALAASRPTAQTPRPVFHGDPRVAGGYATNKPLHCGLRGGLDPVEAAPCRPSAPKRPSRFVYTVKNGSLLISMPPRRHAA